MEVCILIGTEFIDKYVEHDMSDDPGYLGPREGKPSFLLLFKEQLKSVEHITWCQDQDKWESTGATATYGNDWTDVCFYQTAAILVGIPPWDMQAEHHTSPQSNIINQHVKFLHGWGPQINY